MSNSCVATPKHIPFPFLELLTEVSTGNACYPHFLFLKRQCNNVMGTLKNDKLKIQHSLYLYEPTIDI